MAIVNPIASVDGLPVQCPSVFKYSLMDVSRSNAGRTEDGMMHKFRIGQTVKIELAWNALHNAEIAAILTAFDPEYITVWYLNPKIGALRESVFYVGDRSAPLYNTTLGLWENVSFNIVERGVS